MFNFANSHLKLALVTWCTEALCNRRVTSQSLSVEFEVVISREDVLHNFFL